MNPFVGMDLWRKLLMKPDKPDLGACVKAAHSDYMRVRLEVMEASREVEAVERALREALEEETRLGPRRDRK